MEDRTSSRPSYEHEIWSVVHRFRAAFLAMGVSGVAASVGLAAALVAAQPAYLTATIQIWEQMLGPLSGPGGGIDKIYKLNLQHPGGNLS
jgi:hypothetical protein